MMLQLHATPGEVMRAVEALELLGRERLVPEQILFGPALALEECCSNIVDHALGRDARRTFLVTVECTGSAIVMELRDRGPKFDPTHAPLTRKKEGGDDQQPGGWGINLARRHIDEMSYIREGGENVLRLIKKFDLARQSIQFNDTTEGGLIDMKLEVEIQENIGGKLPGIITVKLAGSLDTATSPELERQLAPILAGPVKGLVFDLAHLKFISSAGLRVITIVRKKLLEKGSTIAIVNMQPQIKEVFEIIKALPGLSIFKDLAEFDAYIAARQRMHEEGE